MPVELPVCIALDRTEIWALPSEGLLRVAWR